jgi:3-dehydroquinate synthetase
VDKLDFQLGGHEVLFGIGRNLGADVARWLKGTRADKVLVVTDDTVRQLHEDKLVPYLSELMPTQVLSMPSGETAKTFRVLERLLEEASAFGVTKRTHVLSFGGGVVSNVAGMVAGLLFRGLPLAHVPTTLLAQVDAALSRKQAVNSRHGKNLFGLWLSPEAIFVDLDYLRTLSRRELCNGFAETIKLTLISNLPYFERLEQLTLEDFLTDDNLLEQAVRCGIDMTCRVLGSDPDEGTSGLSLEIGHTIGHAIEMLEGGAVSHGEAVSMGVVLEAWLSVRMGVLPISWVGRIVEVLKRFELPTLPPAGISPAEVLAALRYDNKRISDAPSFVPIRDLGRMAMRSRQGEEALICLESLTDAFERVRTGRLFDDPRPTLDSSALAVATPGV